MRAGNASSGRASFPVRWSEDYPRLKLVINRLANWFIRTIFRHHYNDTTNAFKAYRRGVIDAIQPLLSNHFNLTVEMPLKAIARGHTFRVVPISWTGRSAGRSKLGIREMGSRYLFIALYVWLEAHLSRATTARGRRARGIARRRLSGPGARAEAGTRVRPHQPAVAALTQDLRKLGNRKRSPVPRSATRTPDLLPRPSSWSSAPSASAGVITGRDGCRSAQLTTPARSATRWSSVVPRMRTCSPGLVCAST